MIFSSFLLFFHICSEENSESIFTELYYVWGKSSGKGSSLTQTKVIAQAIPELLTQFDCKTMLDLGCGDYVWMRNINLPVEKYIGADVVMELLIRHQEQFGDDRHNFIYLNAGKDEIPQVDLILCRDFLVHYSDEQIMTILSNIKRSGSKYLLTTTFPNRNQQSNRPTGGWRPLNLLQAPFNFPEPLLIINEQCSQYISGILWDDKCLVLWKISDIPVGN